MWSRVIEIMLGCWLLISPFVFGHWPQDAIQRANDLAAGSIVIVCGLLSHRRPLRRAHLVTLAVGLWLIGFAYLRAGGSAAPPVQNDAVLGLLLLMFGIVPSEASQPPESWARPLSRDS